MSMLALPSPLRRRLPDAEVIRLLAQLSPARLFPGKPSVKRLRRAWQLCVKAFATREAVDEVVERTVTASDGRPVSIRAYIPATLRGRTRKPALLWIHGGGFVFGDLYTAGATCRKLANQCGCVVIAVRYRLAPEASLHDGLNDCLTAFRWLVGEPRELGLDPDLIAVGGDSAGGTLATLVAQRCVAAGDARPLAQLLAYPATNLASSYVDSQIEPIPDRMLSELFRSLQLEIPRRDLDDDSLSPIQAAQGHAMPPTVLLTAGFDPLRDEALAYAEKLSAAGTATRVLHFPGQFHGFLSFDAVLSGAKEAFQRIGDAMRPLFEGNKLSSGVDTADRDFLRSWSWNWLSPAQRFREAVVTIILAREALAAAATRTSGG